MSPAAAAAASQRDPFADDAPATANADTQRRAHTQSFGANIRKDSLIDEVPPAASYAPIALRKDSLVDEVPPKRMRSSAVTAVPHAHSRAVPMPTLQPLSQSSPAGSDADPLSREVTIPPLHRLSYSSPAGLQAERLASRPSNPHVDPLSDDIPTPSRHTRSFRVDPHRDPLSHPPPMTTPHHIHSHSDIPTSSRRIDPLADDEDQVPTPHPHHSHSHSFTALVSATARTPATQQHSHSTRTPLALERIHEQQTRTRDDDRQSPLSSVTQPISLLHRQQVFKKQRAVRHRAITETREKREY